MDLFDRTFDAYRMNQSKTSIFDRWTKNLYNYCIDHGMLVDLAELREKVMSMSPPDDQITNVLDAIDNDNEGIVIDFLMDMGFDLPKNESVNESKKVNEQEDATHDHWVMFDFDGVCAYYRKGWQGPDTIEEAVPGMSELIKELRSKGIKCGLYTCRPINETFNKWLVDNGFIFDSINSADHNPEFSNKFKPIAELYVDDNALKFDPEKPEESVAAIKSKFADIKESKANEAELPEDPEKDEAYKEKEKYFVDRTNKHISLVKRAAEKLVGAYPEFKDLLQNVETHDASKFEEPEKTPYIEITWRHKLEDASGDFDPIKDKGYKKPGTLPKPEENEATIHHITTNSHHPEYYVKDKSLVALNPKDRDKGSGQALDASDMPEISIAEMVCDWQAMTEELKKNTTREWFDKQKDTRWYFSDKQVELIDKLIKVFEGTGPEEKKDVDKTADVKPEKGKEPKSKEGTNLIPDALVKENDSHDLDDEE